MQCSNCGRRLTKAEQLWSRTHGGKQCPYCRGGLQPGQQRPGEHLHPSLAKKGARARRGDRRLTA